MTPEEVGKLIDDELQAYVTEAHHGFGEKVFENYTKEILFRDFALHLAFSVNSVAARSSK